LWIVWNVARNKHLSSHGAVSIWRYSATIPCPTAHAMATCCIATRRHWNIRVARNRTPDSPSCSSNDAFGILR